MTESVVYEQLDQEAGGQETGVPGTQESSEGVDGGHEADADLRRLSDVPVELSVEIGRARMTVGETLQLRAGSIVTLERLAGEPVDLLVNGTPIARGEVVVVDEQFGMRVTEVVEGDSMQTLAEGPPAAAADERLEEADPTTQADAPAPE